MAIGRGEKPGPGVIPRGPLYFWSPIIIFDRYNCMLEVNFFCCVHKIFIFNCFLSLKKWVVPNSEPS